MQAHQTHIRFLLSFDNTYFFSSFSSALSVVSARFEGANDK